MSANHNSMSTSTFDPNDPSLVCQPSPAEKLQVLVALTDQLRRVEDKMTVMEENSKILQEKMDELLESSQKLNALTELFLKRGGFPDQAGGFPPRKRKILVSKDKAGKKSKA